MNEETRLQLAKKLEEHSQVAFVTDGWDKDHSDNLLVIITEGSDGWDVRTYDIYEDVEELDGGWCTGSALDAVEFMLPGEAGVNE